MKEMIVTYQLLLVNIYSQACLHVPIDVTFSNSIITLIKTEPLINQLFHCYSKYGKLKQGFPMLHHKIQVKREKIPSLVLSCFILHNVTKYLHDEDLSILEDISNNEDDAFQLVDYGEAVLRERRQLRRDASVEANFERSEKLVLG
nr:unnamed protein product [Callosobruchus analis]